MNDDLKQALVALLVGEAYRSDAYLVDLRNYPSLHVAPFGNKSDFSDNLMVEVENDGLAAYHPGTAMEGSRRAALRAVAGACRLAGVPLPPEYRYRFDGDGYGRIVLLGPLGLAALRASLADTDTQ